MREVEIGSDELWSGFDLSFISGRWSAHLSGVVRTPEVDSGNEARAPMYAIRIVTDRARVGTAMTRRSSVPPQRFVWASFYNAKGTVLNASARIA